MSFYPSADDVLQGTEEILLRVRRSFRSVISLMLYFFIAFGIVVVLNVIFHDSPYVSSGLLRALSIIPLLFFLDIFRRYYDEVCCIERHKMTLHTGRLSLKYEIPSVKYIDIRTIQVDQDIFGRILDYGNVLVGTAAQEGYELNIEGVRAPRELQKLLEAVRDASVQEITSGAGLDGNTPNELSAMGD